MIASSTPGTHILRFGAQTVTNRLREIGERSPYKMYVLYAAFLFLPSILTFYLIDDIEKISESLMRFILLRQRQFLENEKNARAT